MRILIIGSGDAFSTTRYGCCALVEGPAGRVMIDCPAPIHRAAREAAERARWDVDVAAIDDIIVTHLHGDHSNGLEAVGFDRRMRRPDAGKPRLHINEDAAKRLWEKLAPAMDGSWPEGKASRGLGDFFEVKRLVVGKVSEVAGLRVECRMTGHPVPTTALRLSDGRRMVGWSSDTPFDEGLIGWLGEADVVIHETSHGPVHTALEALNGLPAAVRGRMRLIHLPDDFEQGATDIRGLEAGEVLEV
ncbi:MAG: MBL fold metallo-hydrolase [Planctomycetota bacterium]|nr:MBL fold metallo-hydrolase [Planctomycetota bacterium]